MKVFYHVIEQGDYGNIATHGFFKSLAEAQKEASRLQNFFPNCFFYAHSSPSKREPEFVTV